MTSEVTCVRINTYTDLLGSQLGRHIGAQPLVNQEKTVCVAGCVYMHTSVVVHTLFYWRCIDTVDYWEHSWGNCWLHSWRAACQHQLAYICPPVSSRRSSTGDIASIAVFALTSDSHCFCSLGLYSITFYLPQCRVDVDEYWGSVCLVVKEAQTGVVYQNTSQQDSQLEAIYP